MESETYSCLHSRNARILFGFEDDQALRKNSPEVHGIDWVRYISQSINEWPKPHDLLPIGASAFDLFLQINVTGPPLLPEPTDIVFPPRILNRDEKTVKSIRKNVTVNLSADGEAVYQLISNVELFYLAKCIYNTLLQDEDPVTALGRLRVNFWHQKLLTEISPSLQERIYQDLDYLSESILIQSKTPDDISSAQFLIERANVHSYHGFDDKAREDLIQAAKLRSFDFVLTGRLGKRTKFQEKELSQLVVLAKSAEPSEVPNAPQSGSSTVVNIVPDPRARVETAPQALELNDETLLESISFAAEKPEDQALPTSLQSLDPGNQPRLEPLDAIILLATASSVTNRSPADGLTREETLPFAERVISGGSSNWQVYTQALLVRSRIEGYRSRTIERGVLQLQAVVDQVIAETTSPGMTNGGSGSHGSTERSRATFLPQPKPSESAPVSERLQFIHQLACPPRWKLESELADRWVYLGGLRTALEIYERLQMWAEVALCWAANDQEEKARKILRQELYESVDAASAEDSWKDLHDGKLVERDPLPADAPRLFCILGDIEKSKTAYLRAWEVSNNRYARAQRSLGKHYSAAGDLSAADEAYTKSLKINPQNHPTWFALGCIRLQTENWVGAVNAFGRAVQIEDADAESWSNLAVALLNLPPSVSLGDGVERAASRLDTDEEDQNTIAVDPQRHVREAFVALKRAAALKRDSFRIWQNLLSISVKLSPPPYTDIVLVQTRLIDLLGKLEGEKCVDVDIVEALVAHLIVSSPPPIEREKERRSDDQGTEEDKIRRSGLEKPIVDLVQKKIIPLITSSRRLWLLAAKLSLHLGRPSAALASYEKAWRVTLNQPTWNIGDGTAAAKDAWREVSESTIDLADAYESLGERPKESGMGAGEPVAKDWKFKARSALRSVISKAKIGWEGDQLYESLQERLAELKSW